MCCTFCKIRVTLAQSYTNSEEMYVVIIVWFFHFDELSLAVKLSLAVQKSES